MAIPVLQIKDLEVSFVSNNTETQAVKRISFDLYPGKTLGIVGESGSGKSVTSLATLGLIPNPSGRISGGQILLNGEAETIDLTALSQKGFQKIRGNHISMIFQEPMTSLNPVFTCGNQVAEAVRLHQKLDRKSARSKTIELFEKVKLPRPEMMFDAFPHQLSGGQKQRVMIAMALSCNPSVLIADEPTTALDVTVQKTILQLLKELQKEHQMAMIFITHDLGVIHEVADDVVVMYKGKIMEVGNAQKVFEQPQNPYTKGLLACRPPLDKRYTKLPVVTDFMAEKDGEIIDKIDDLQGYLSFLIEPKSTRVLAHEVMYKKPPVLEVENLKVHFPAATGFFGKPKSWVKAVDGISFNVYPGETLGLIGESGCGKTTTGRAIVNLNAPTDGVITHKGKNIQSLAPSELKEYQKEVQIIFQDPYSSLNPRKSIGNAIMEPMEVYKIGANKNERRAMAEDLLEKVGLEKSHFSRYPHEFSGGQRQRICIARTLAVQPKFIICDESVSALDVSVQAQVLNLLNDLKKDLGLTYIFISHDLSVVKFMCDRMIVLNKNGQVEQSGDCDAIYENPATPYVEELINSILV